MPAGYTFEGNIYHTFWCWDLLSAQFFQFLMQQEAAGSPASYLLSWHRRQGQLSLKISTSSNMHLLCLLLSHKRLLYRNSWVVKSTVQKMLSLLGLAVGCLGYFGDDSYSLSLVLLAMAKAEKEICLMESWAVSQHWIQGMTLGALHPSFLSSTLYNIPENFEVRGATWNPGKINKQFLQRPIFYSTETANWDFRRQGYIPTEQDIN